jgi:hypothetical protein
MMSAHQAKKRLEELAHEAERLEEMEIRRDLHPHEWSRLCGLYEEIRILESSMEK